MINTPTSRLTRLPSGRRRLAGSARLAPSTSGLIALARFAPTTTAETVVEVSGEHGLPQYARWGALSKAWARARLGDRETGLAELREALEANTGTGRGQFLPLYHGLLAELEAEGEETEAALARTDAALTCAPQTGELWTDAFLHRKNELASCRHLAGDGRV